ncbi:amidase [Halalkalirubrum salinum]|uniref:amidase n=1 Tax=Halalkalirubrum salinum TaxID=2563889 RepID=UPI001F0E3C98|nr:amidase family protein [Halalkalirubrum salinum]
MPSTTDTHTFDVTEATVSDVHEAMEAGELTAVALVKRYLARIDAFDDELNAILTVNDRARERAQRLDEQFNREGFVGPLHGIPMLIKDNQNTSDMPTTAGSKALAESVPPTDAFVVAQLREAGGIILAKTNLQELSFGVDTISSLGGETRNAYALDRRPSGSSGGTAAAIAANLGVLGTGSDTCSSVRSPPAFNNLVGVRPTRGLVSRSGIIPLSETQDTAGPITRTVEDAARMLDVLCGYDSEDPVSARGIGRVPEGGYVSHLDEDGLEGARIGVVRQFFGLQDEASASQKEAETVTATIESALDELQAAGATIVDPVAVAETGYLQSARVLQYEFKRDFDAYLTELGEDAPFKSLESIVESGLITPSVAARIADSDILATDVEGLDHDLGYLRRLDRRRQLRIDTERRMVEADLDALLYPPSTVPPVRIPKHQPFGELNCELSAHTGLPSIVVQAGCTEEGLPVGFELLGREFGEPRLFELAYAYEQAAGHRRPPRAFGTIE